MLYLAIAIVALAPMSVAVWRWRLAQVARLARPPSNAAAGRGRR
ncbi:MAG: hypothetical protein R3B06_25935 [Kofleriaceae bacterium]